MKRFIFLSFCVLLTVTNFGQLAESQSENAFGKLTTIGRGWIRNLVWDGDNNLISVTTDSGTWEYTNDLQEIAYSPTSSSSIEPDPSSRLSPDQTKTAFIQENYQIEIQDNLGSILSVIPPVTNAALHPEILWHPNSQQLLRHNFNSSYGGLFQVWNAETGELEKEFQPGGDTYDVSFSPDGNYLAIAPNGIYDATTYEKLLDFGSLYPARNIWSPSSKFIALNDFNWSPHEGTISILDVQTQEIIQTLTGQVGFVLKIVWSLDETEIISLDANQTITKWDVTKGQQIARVDDYSWVGRIDEQVAFDSSGALIAIADRVDTIRLFDTTNGVLKSTLIGHTGEINGMVWQPQGNLLATKTGITIGDEPQDGGTVRIWDGHTGQLVDLIDHQSSQINSIAWSPDGSALAIVSHRGQMQVWDSSHQRIWFSEQAAGVPIVSWSPHSYHIMLYFMAGSHGLMGAKLFHPVTGENSWGTVTNFSHDALAWTEDDQLLLNAGVRCRDYRPPRNCYIAINPLFDADKLPNPQPYVYERVSQLEPTITLEAHLAAVNAVQWNKNATYIAANDVDGELRVWQFSLNENQLALSLNDVVGINWSPDGQRLGVVKRGNTVEIWNVVTGELDLKLNQNGINHLLWSPDSAMLVTWGETQLTRIWNAHTGELLAELEHSGTVVWSPDSRKVAQNANGVVTIWGYQ